MLKKYKKKSNLCLLLFILMTPVFFLVVGSSLPETVKMLLGCPWVVLLVAAICYVVKGKGYPWVIGIPIAFFLIPIGGIVLLLLPDRCKEEK